MSHDTQPETPMPGPHGRRLSTGPVAPARPLPDATAPVDRLDVLAVKHRHVEHPEQPGVCRGCGAEHPCDANRLVDVAHRAIDASYRVLDTLVTQHGVGHPLVRSHMRRLGDVAKRAMYPE